MAYKVQSSFAAGELDPALRERTTLGKYNSGLAKLKGFSIGKTGRIISLPGTKYDGLRKYNDRKCVVYYPPFSDYEVEVGHEYIRVHNLVDKTYNEFTPPADTDPALQYYQQEDLERLHFASDKTHLYIYHPRYISYKMVLGDLDPDGSRDMTTRFTEVIWNYDSSAFVDLTATGSPTGYDVEYITTIIINGQESLVSEGLGVVSGKLPAAVSQSNKITVTTDDATLGTVPSEIYVYRRVKGGTAWGFIGSSKFYTTETVPNVHREFTFVDVGGAADYTHNPPNFSQEMFDDINDSYVRNIDVPPYTTIDYRRVNRFPTGAIYQQRQILSGRKDLEAIFTSRVKYKNSFLTESYINAASALTLKSGTTGRARVLRLFDGGPLIAFTTAGVYSNSGNAAFDQNNIGMVRRGNWIADEIVPPLAIPGGFLFVEKSTGAIIQFNYSNELDGFSGGETTIYSDHLFRGKRVKSWAFQSGLTPVIWVVMNDGTLNFLTYLPEQQMMAWGWDNTDGDYETVGVHTTLEGKNEVYFTVNRNGFRTREVLADRFNVPFAEFVGCHSSQVYMNKIGPVNIQVTDFDVVLIGPNGTFSNTPGKGEVGTIFRYFTTSGTPVDFKITNFVDENRVEGVIVDERIYPDDPDSYGIIYETFTTLTGLDHLEGKSVYVKSDGFVQANPFKVDDAGNLELPEKIVTGGEITLDEPGAIVIVGLTAVGDIQTLDIDTVEQQPALLASVNLNKVYIAFFNSRGLWVGHEFPEDDTNKGMVEVEAYDYDATEIIAAETPIIPFTKRLEIIEAGSWRSHGMLSLRNVDCHPVEILSIIPDLTVERR